MTTTAVHVLMSRHLQSEIEMENAQVEYRDHTHTCQTRRGLQRETIRMYRHPQTRLWVCQFVRIGRVPAI